MFFGGGLQGFIDDIGCALESTVHTATHPEIWGINSYEPPKEEKIESVDDLLRILETLGTDEKAINSIVEIISKMDDISITQEEYDKLLDKLKDIKITISLADFISQDPKPNEDGERETTETEKVKEPEPVNTSKEVDEEDKISFKEAIMSTPLGHKLRLFEEVNTEEKSDDAVTTA